MDEAPGLKIWPMLGLAAIVHKHAGAWRAWEIARHLDQSGSGRIERPELTHYLNGFVSDPRTSRRWITDALNIGLFKPSGEKTIYLASVVTACEALFVERIGYAAKVHIETFCRKGWRAYVFEAYNSTLSGPASQRTKQELTHIKTRTQRNYLRKGLGQSRKNYALRSEPVDYAIGLQEERGLTVFVNQKGELIQRGPDLRVVPSNIALPTHRGRSRKIQKQLNASSCILARGNRGGCFKMFCETEAEAEKARREIEHSDFPHKPREVFQLTHVNEVINLWKVINVEG